MPTAQSLAIGRAVQQLRNRRSQNVASAGEFTDSVIIHGDGPLRVVMGNRRGLETKRTW